MTISVQNTVLTSTFDFWRNRTNQMAYSLSNQVITTDGGSQTSITTSGNAAITGTFTANVLVSNTATINTATINSAAISIITGNTLSVNTISTNNIITIGNSTVNAVINSTSFTLANSTVTFPIKKPTAAQVSDGNYYYNANGNWSSVNVATPVVNNQISTSGTTSQLIDSYAVATYQSAEYLIYVKDNLGSNRYSSKMLTLYDGSSSMITEYAQLISSGAVGTFSSNANSTHVRLYFTPISIDNTVKYVRTAV